MCVRNSKVLNSAHLHSSKSKKPASRHCGTRSIAHPFIDLIIMINHPTAMNHSFSGQLRMYFFFYPGSGIGERVK